jgi:retinol dehydrogenase-12
MENFDSVKEFAKRAVKLERLDVVVENPGFVSRHYELMEGMESTIAVNVVGAFLLALNLLLVLRKLGKKHGFLLRLVIASSEVQFWVSDSTLERYKTCEQRLVIWFP